MHRRRLQILHDIGIQPWRLRNASSGETEVSTASERPAETAEEGDLLEHESAPNALGCIEELDWPGLEAAVADCQRCDELLSNRTRTVFGIGNHDADWLVVGEAPGSEEDRQGEPFVGKAGQLLNQMLLAVGLERRQVYIANTLKCHPPNNREPHPEEAAACRDYLERQIALIRPKVILVVGHIAAQNLLATDTPIGKLRGRLHHHEASGTPIIVTYHPAYLLRSPAEKRKSWEDLQLAQATLLEGGG